MTEIPGNQENLFGRVTVDVDQGNTAHLQGEGVIATEGVGPCLGVSFYSQERKLAYVAHLNSPLYNRPEILDEFVDEALAGLQESEFRIWLGGY